MAQSTIINEPRKFSGINKNISENLEKANSVCLDTNKKSVRARQKFRIDLYKMRKVSGGFKTTDADWKRGYSSTKICGCKTKGFEGDTLPINVVKGQKGAVYFQGLLKCGSMWRCPVCSYKLTQHKQNQVYFYSSEWQRKNPSNKISFVTLTIKHHKNMTLKMSLENLVDEFRKYQRTKVFERLNKKNDTLGFIKSIEITWNEKNGWHPHLHLLFFHQSENIESYHKELVSNWIKRVKIKGTKSAQKCKEVFSVKGITDYVTKWDISREMTNTLQKKSKTGSLSPFEILKMLTDKNYTTLSKEKLESLYSSYCRVTTGKHKIHISKKIKEALLTEEKKVEFEKSDIEILEDDKVEKLLLQIDQELWQEIVEKEMQAEILNAMEIENFDQLFKLFYKKEVKFLFEPIKKILKPLVIKKKIEVKIPISNPYDDPSINIW